MPEKEREHQKRANIPSNRIFGLKLEKGKEEGNGKKYHCKRKKNYGRQTGQISEVV